MIKVIDRLTKTVRTAAVFNPDVQAAPACILWPDRDRKWEKARQLAMDYTGTSTISRWKLVRSLA